MSPNSPQEVIDWANATTPTANSLMTDDHHNGNLVPGKMAVHHNAANILFRGLELSEHDFEVLCAQLNAVEWIPAYNGSVPPKAIIAGNTHSGEPLYIGMLNCRCPLTPSKKTKWMAALSEGALVLVKHKSLLPLQWLLGRVQKVHPGGDGVVRVTDIMTHKGKLRRGCNNIFPLPVEVNPSVVCRMEIA